MNDIINSLRNRKSVRAFTEQKITEEEKLYILEAAVNAPSAGNQQLYTIIDVTDQKLKDALVDTCDHQPFIAKAEMVLIFAADCHKWYEGFCQAGCEPRLPEEGDLMLAVVDSAIAAQNAVTAAESLGIGSCYIGDIMENCEEQRRLLNLPKYTFPAVMVVFGYPTQQQKDRKKPERAPMNTIVFENSYPEMKEDFYATLFSGKYKDGEYDSWITAFCNRKYNSDFSREMSRSVREYLKQYQAEE